MDHHIITLQNGKKILSCDSLTHERMLFDITLYMGDYSDSLLSQRKDEMEHCLVDDIV